MKMVLVTPTELKERTLQFALRVLEVVDALPHTAKGKAIVVASINTAKHNRD